MGMKRQLTVLLVTVLCFVCAGAAADCTHPNAYQSSRWENVVYESTGDLKEHEVSYDSYKYMYCPDCWTRFSEIFEGRKWDTGSHYWNSENVCLYCNQTNVCTHGEEHAWFTERNYQYTQTGNVKTHSVTYDWYQITDCALCGLRLSESLVTTKTKDGNHNWNNSSICWSCGQENACAHEEQKAWFTSRNHQYQQTGDEKKHRLTYDWYKIVDCLQCGMKLSETLVDTKTVDRSHNWNEEGICQDCGQANTCIHDKTRIGNETYSYRYEQIGDAANHRVTCKQYQVTFCTVCEQRLSTSEAEIKTEIESHNWNEQGICWSCGQVNGCSHSETTIGNETRNNRYEQIGDVKNHRVIYDQYEITKCNLCGQKVSETDATTKTRNESHNWNDAGICWNCGQENVCAHGETSSVLSDWHHQYQQTGDVKTHQVTYDRYRITDCALCGLRLSEEYLKTVIENWDHNWNDAGICWNCGQENVCAHGKTSSWTTSRNYQYQQTGDVKTHQVTYDRYTITECSLCRQQISEAFVETITENWNHIWNDEGICQNCGQENVCAHGSVVESAYSTDYQYTKNDANTHLQAFTVKIRRRCSVCNQVLDERVGGQYEVEQKHSWGSDGICWNCGEINTCEHKNVYVDSSRRRHYTDTGDGLHHSVKETVTFYSDCSDCGQRIDEREEISDYTEEHANLYRCWKCDYETECPHEGTRYEAVDSIDVRYAVINEKRHALYGRTETHVYCDDCGEELSVTQSEAEELLNTEAHYWNNRGICSECGFENPCTHGNTDVRLVRVKSSCVAQNDAMHVQTIIYKEVACCADCGITLGEISSLKKVVTTEAHDFNDKGRCWDCGYVNRCAHDGATHTGTELGEWWGDAVCIDDKTHKVDREVLSTVYCDLCGGIVSQDNLGRQWVVQEHEMYEDHCELCDYRIGCAHETTVEKLLPDTEYLYCESISDNAHAATCRLVAYDCCETCGALLNGRTVGMTKINEPHNMVNHRCVECGYCEHPAEQIETTYESRGQREYIEQNAYLHKSFIWYDYTSVCKLCGNTVETWSQKGKNLTEEHYYDEQGICRKCGYVNECLHENGYRVPLGHDMFRYENIGDENQHLLSEWLASEMFCPDCLMSWDHQTEEEPVVSMEEHRFRVVNGINVCTRCDYVSDRLPESCQHEHTEKWTYFGEQLSGYEYIDEDYHAVYGTDLYEAIDCHDCHYTISETLVQEGRVLREANEVHIFDRNGVCRCGYVNPCKHENTVIDATGTDGKYVLQVDDTHHERVSIMKKSVHCADCGIWLSDIEQREERSLYEEHSFNKFGVCRACNYVNGCKHEQTQVNYDYGLKSCYAIDNAQHEITQTIQKREECLTCGEVIGTEFVEEVTEKQNHDGAEACSICGWKTAKHIHVWELPDEQVCSATAIDALTHKIVTQIAGHYRCLECGDDEGQEIVLPAESVIEPHNFTDLGRCADCGYVNFCAHEETYEVQKPVFEPTYQMKDELEHTYTASIRTETRCVTCNQRLSYTAALNVECTEEHVFDNVADLICDLCGYEKEAPEEAATPEPTPEPTDTPAPTKKPGGGSGGSGSSGGTNPDKPKETSTPTPEEALPKTGDNSRISLWLSMLALAGVALMALKRKTA